MPAQPRLADLLRKAKIERLVNSRGIDVMTLTRINFGENRSLEFGCLNFNAAGKEIAATQRFDIHPMGRK